MKTKIDFFSNDIIEAIGACIYEISVEKNGQTKELYIGESVFGLVRCATHLYALKKNPEYLGFTQDTIEDSSITLRFRVIESIEDNVQRKAREKEIIKERNPLSQSQISDRQKNVEEKVAALTEFLDYTKQEYEDSKAGVNNGHNNGLVRRKEFS